MATLTPQKAQQDKSDGAFSFFAYNGSTEALKVLDSGPLANFTNKGDSKDASSMDHLLAALDYIDKCNEIRAAERLSPLKVSDYAMATAIHNTNWSDTNMDHSRQYGGAENLAWGTTTPDAAFKTWYTDEKNYYNAHVDEYANARSMSAYELYQNYPAFYSKVGHYLNVISTYTITGFAISNDSSYGIALGQRFLSSSPGDVYTVAEYRQRLQDYIALLDAAIAGVVDQNLQGTAQNDSLTGGEGDDTISGDAGKDTLEGWTGNDLLYGEAGNDTLFGGGGDDSLYGGTSHDRLYGGKGNDLLDGGNGQDFLSGEAGNDSLKGGGGNDTLNGGKGNDRLWGGAGKDTLRGEADNDVLKGEAGDDWLTGGDGTDYLSGGEGKDTLNGGLDNDTLVGGGGADNLEGSGGDDSLKGELGADLLTGGAGNDSLDGGADNDTLKGGADNDLLDGGSGDDFLSGDAGNDSVKGSLGNDTLNGGLGDDRLWGGAGDDTLRGEGGNDVLKGEAGRDWLSGGDGADYLSGAGDNDILYGGAGKDSLSGGAGNDRLTGEAGQDFFLFDSALGKGNVDQITDFKSGEDTLQLKKSIFASLNVGALDASNFLASANGAATSSTHFILYNTTSGALSYDADGSGSGAAVQFATLTNKTKNVTASDFTVVS